MALLIGFGHVSGVQPSVGFGNRFRLILLSIGLRDVFSAHQDFALLINANFHAREDFADGAFCGVERMIQTDERSGFGHAVSLNYGVAEAVPEGFHLFRQSGTAGDESPKFPTETRMDSPESPPAPEEVFFFGAGKVFVELLEPAIAFQLALDF